jgi:hypothetical protein
MANTGLTWSAYSAVQIGAGDWTSNALADAATETGDSTSIDGKAACVVTVIATEDNTGAIDGPCTIYILNDCDGTNFEEPDIGTPYKQIFTPVQNDTVRIPVPVDPRVYKNFKVAVENQAGQEVAITVKIATADIALAS